jgi:formylglycine-generating enzyme required for sulfatase activity
MTCQHHGFRLLGGIMTKSIFISHSSQDAVNSRRLAEDLKRAGLQVWLDEWNIAVGEGITDKLQSGLISADYLAVWLTRASVESGWVGREWQSKYQAEIADNSTIILPLLAEDCTIPPLLADKKYADFRSNYMTGMADLLRSVGLWDWESPSGMKFRLVVPGAFMMGSLYGEENERPPHQSTINWPFYMGIYTVTQGDWMRLMQTEPWKGVPHVREGDNFPAVNVTWFDVQAYLTRLSETDKDNSYYLPTEDEWEYAARAGTTTEFSFGDDERDMRYYGWSRDITQNAEEYPHEVGRKRANAWGLYDMHGNVWEWTDNWYFGSYEAQPRMNPDEKVLRGGAWDYRAYGARSAFRVSKLPNRTDPTVGFRIIRRPAVI